MGVFGEINKNVTCKVKKLKQIPNAKVCELITDSQDKEVIKEVIKVCLDDLS